MLRRNADKVIRLLAYHVNGHLWENGHFRHREKSRNYTVAEAVEAAELLSHVQQCPEKVYRKLHLSKLDDHVVGKIVCTAGTLKNAVDFDLHGRDMDRDVPWGVVEISHFGHVIDVRAALTKAAEYASVSHACLVRELVCSGGSADEAEHVVVLARRVTTSDLLVVNDVDYFDTLVLKDRKRILRHARKHAKGTYLRLTR